MRRKEVRLSLALPYERWMRLRRYAEARKGNGRTSVAGVIREMIENALVRSRQQGKVFTQTSTAPHADNGQTVEAGGR